MAELAEACRKEGITVYVSEQVEGIEPGAVTTDRRTIPSDLVVLGLGVEPNSALAEAAGISLDIWARAALGKIAHEVVSAELHRHRDDVQAAAQVGLAEGVRLLKAGRPGQAAEILEHSHQLVKAAGIRNAWVSPLLPWLTTALRQQAQATTNLTPARRRSLLRRAHTVVVKGLRVARSFQNDLPHALREYGMVLAMQGRRRHARRALDESVAVAERQGQP